MDVVCFVLACMASRYLIHKSCMHACEGAVICSQHIPHGDDTSCVFVFYDFGIWGFSDLLMFGFGECGMLGFWDVGNSGIGGCWAFVVLGISWCDFGTLGFLDFGFLNLQCW